VTRLPQQHLRLLLLPQHCAWLRVAAVVLLECSLNSLAELLLLLLCCLL
jgi:hypothetical protein